MKRLIVISCCLIIAILSGACTKATDTKTTSSIVDKKTSSTVDSTETKSSQTDQTESKTALSIATTITNKLKGEKATSMAAEMIGAKDGASFKYNGQKYEIYLFDDKAKIDQAKTGKFKFTLEGFGEFEMVSFVNGEYVMLCDKPEQKVIDEFNKI